MLLTTSAMRGRTPASCAQHFSMSAHTSSGSTSPWQSSGTGRFWRSPFATPMRIAKSFKPGNGRLLVHI
jgi:hypothetical protein